MWTRIFASHPDHLAAGEAALGAVYPDARNPYAHPELAAEGFEPWSVDQVWLMAHDTPNRWVDVTATIDRQVAALRCHASQLPEPDGPRGADAGMDGATAAAGGMPAGHTGGGVLRDRHRRLSPVGGGPPQPTGAGARRCRRMASTAVDGASRAPSSSAAGSTPISA